MKNEMYTRGVFTPTAHVICYECHDTSYRPSEKLANTNKRPLQEGNGVTKCDMCGTDIQLDDSVAEEHNLVAEFKALGFDAVMAQTGGMNSACEINTKVEDDNLIEWISITYNYGGDNEYAATHVLEEGDDWEEVTCTTDKAEFMKAITAFVRKGESEMEDAKVKELRDFRKHMYETTELLQDELDEGKDYDNKFDLHLELNGKRVSIEMCADLYHRLVKFVDDTIEEESQ